MAARTTTLIAGTSGIVVVVAGFFDTTSDPPSGATAEETPGRWYEQNLDSIGLSVTAGAVELAAITIFVVALAQLMRAAEEPRRLLTDLATASGILVAVWLWLYAASAMIPLVMADDDGRLTAVPDTAVMAFDSIRRFNETIGDLSAGTPGPAHPGRLAARAAGPFPAAVDRMVRPHHRHRLTPLRHRPGLADSAVRHRRDDRAVRVLHLADTRQCHPAHPRRTDEARPQTDR